MTWLKDLLENNTGIALDDEADRARLVQAFALAFPVDHLSSVLLASVMSVLRVARAEGAVVSTADMLTLAERLVRNSVQTTIALLLDQSPPRITRDDLELARNAGAVAMARLRAYDAENEAIELHHALEAARAENALLRGRAEALSETYVVPEKAIRS